MLIPPSSCHFKSHKITSSSWSPGGLSNYNVTCLSLPEDVCCMSFSPCLLSALHHFQSEYLKDTNKDEAQYRKYSVIVCIVLVGWLNSLEKLWKLSENVCHYVPV